MVGCRAAAGMVSAPRVTSAVGSKHGNGKMETLFALIIGVGLSAACGFRVFVPMLGLSLASATGHLTLSPGFEWIGTWPAVIAFSAATVLEIGTYYVPWLDNLMDAAATPAAVVAGTIVTASMVSDFSPFLNWSLAIIAGGGVAGIVQTGSVALRAASTGTTGGLANPVLSTLEAAGSVAMTVLAILLPVLCLVIVLWLCYKAVSWTLRSPVLRRLLAKPTLPADSGGLGG